MANYIPRITYNELVTGDSKTFTFDSPPEGDPYNEELIPNYKAERSSNGTRQVQFNYLLKKYKLEFKFQSLSLVTSFKDFYNNHASRGGSFNYYVSSDEADYETMELSINSVKFERPIFSGSDFEYNFEFSIEAAVDATLELDTGELGVGALSETEFTIVNNQSSAADITGLSFDATEVRSFFVDYSVYRNTTGAGATELAESGVITGVYSNVADAWEINRSSVGDAGLTITITTAGQLQYESTNITGTPASSVMRFKASTLSQ